MAPIDEPMRASAPISAPLVAAPGRLGRHVGGVLHGVIEHLDIAALRQRLELLALLGAELVAGLDDFVLSIQPAAELDRHRYRSSPCVCLWERPGPRPVRGYGIDKLG